MASADAQGPMFEGFNGNGRTVPWFVRAAVYFVEKLGATTVIALVLVYLMGWRIDRNLEALTIEVRTHIGDSALERQEIRYLLLALCRNIADTTEEWQRCGQ